MKTRKFKCTLGSDIVLSELAATEGFQRTLDYIPGNVFLGIVAAKLYEKIDPQLAMDVFHNAKVRFSDAFPLIGGKRAIKVPTSWYVKKGDTIKDQIYIHHKMPINQPTTQLRDKFIVKEDSSLFSEVKTEKNFALKSAYNSEKRRSMDQQMYGYQSLEAGLELCFQVDFDNSIDNNTIKEVIAILTNDHTVGRSKTAQYGQVKIVEIVDSSIEQGFHELDLLEPNKTFLYAESRLLFIDDYGQPFIPVDGKYYEIEGAKVDLNLSQIRTFRYAPYNSKRKSRDADRFGIEKGSVICINRAITNEEIGVVKNGIGLYQNEGFGIVLINPEFLKVKSDCVSGEAYFSNKPSEEIINEKIKLKSSEIELPETLNENPAFSYLIRSLKKEEEKQTIYSKVIEFVEDNKSLFENSNEHFASQWGTIRIKAMQAKSKSELMNALFQKAENEGYLVSGQSALKWKDAQIRNLEKFMKDLEEPIALNTMINLSSEMAKKCKKGAKK